MKKKVFVGMSGGVDSSVTAAILKEQGYDVTGVFIKVWQPDFIECTWKEDRLDAMRVASVLDIPFMTLDLEKEYKEGVIDYMISEYKNGRTPNPDVMCNREVKFGAFLKWALAQGADYIATGHYSNIKTTDNRQQTTENREYRTDNREQRIQDRQQRTDDTKTNTNYHYLLKVSKDINKDQTYFLWTLTSEQLKNILFPVGYMTKDEVRILAEKYNLPTKNKKDSQGLCFVGNIDLKTLLKNYIEEKRGDVVNEKGEIIGYHEGITFFTIGERHGFVITKKTTEDKPYFVISKNIKENTLVVSNNTPYEEKGNVISLENVNWTKEIKKGDIYEARSRYRAPLAKIEIIDELTIKIIDGDITKTSGQSLVLYDGCICIGGGIIR